MAGAIMDLNHFIRLDLSRQELENQRRRVEDSVEAEVAEALRPILVNALEALKLLHDDDDTWGAAEHAVQTLPTRPLSDVRLDYAVSLPGLLELFGYQVPPPPSARQLVNETVNLIDSAADGDALAAEVLAAREKLGELLRRAEELPVDPPWRLAQKATEVNGFLELGVQVGVGAVAGGVAGAFAGVLGGAITGGLAPVAGFIVLGGVRRFQRVKAIQREAERLAEEHAHLTSEVFTTAAAVVAEHLNRVVELSAEAGSLSDLNAALELRANLDAVIDISRRFVLGEPRLVTVVRQARLQGNYEPGRLLQLFGHLYRAADVARAQVATNEVMSRDVLDELVSLLRVL